MKDVHNENETTSKEIAGLDGNDEFSTAHLPSRKEIHGKKKQKTKVKIKFPFVKMLALFFVIILGTVWAIATQITKDGDSAKSSSEKDSEYTESIGEISGFEDDEEAEEAAPEKESASEENKEAATDSAEQEEQESAEEEKMTEEKEVTTAETTESTEQSAATTEQTTSSTTKNNGVIEHVVQPNENLFRIALKYYSSAEGVEIIKQYNGLSNNDIVVGRVLKIPPR